MMMMNIKMLWRNNVSQNKTYDNYRAYKIGDIKRLIYDNSDSKKLAELKKMVMTENTPEIDI